jgi:PIN domain nuclease of toxin-antitoxin system
MRLLLDTATLIYAVEMPERLSRRAAAAIQNLSNALELSAISVAEIAIKAALNKLTFSAATLNSALEELGIRVLPYKSDHAFHLFGLPRHHDDPFDRQIIAQALCEKISVVTPDEKFSLYKGLSVLW